MTLDPPFCARRQAGMRNRRRERQAALRRRCRARVDRKRNQGAFRRATRKGKRARRRRTRSNISPFGGGNFLSIAVTSPRWSAIALSKRRERRAPRESFSAEYARLLQDINHRLHIRRANGDKFPPPPSPRTLATPYSRSRGAKNNHFRRFAARVVVGRGTSLCRRFLFCGRKAIRKESRASPIFFVAEETAKECASLARDGGEVSRKQIADFLRLPDSVELPTKKGARDDGVFGRRKKGRENRRELRQSDARFAARADAKRAARNRRRGVGRRASGAGVFARGDSGGAGPCRNRLFLRAKRATSKRLFSNSRKRINCAARLSTGLANRAGFRFLRSKKEWRSTRRGLAATPPTSANFWRRKISTPIGRRYRRFENRRQKRSG